MDILATNITERDGKYYRLIGDIEIECEKTGNFFMKVLNEVFNSDIPTELQQQLHIYFQVGECDTFNDVFKSVVIDDTHTTFKATIYNAEGYRLTNVTDFEAQLVCNIFGIDNIVDKPVFEDIVI